jgi:hypothetical protein
VSSDHNIAARIKGLLKGSAWLLLCFVWCLPLVAGDGSGASGGETQAPATQGSLTQQTASLGETGKDSVAPAAAPASRDNATAEPKNPAKAAAASAAANTGGVPASYVNSWLPSWLHLSGELRIRPEGRTGYGFTPDNNYSSLLTRVRIGLDITPTSWFHVFVQARDSEFIGTVPSNLFSAAKDVFDINQAFVELRNGEKGWFSLKVGRQELSFGDERLIARSNWSNASRSFDAVRLTLCSKQYGITADSFASSVVKNYPTSFDQVLPGQNFYGLNVGFAKLVPKATLEPYVYLKSLPNVTGADKKSGNERLYTTGLRWSGTIPGGFDYRARYSLQRGHLANNSTDASAYYGVLGYTLPGRFEPRFSIEYNYASGNKAIGSTVTGIFDQLYPTTHQWRRLTDLFGEQNIKDLKPGFDFKPLAKLRVYLVYSDLSLASRYDSLYNNSGSVLVKVPKGGALSTDIGKEADVYGTYDVNRRLQFGAGFGHLFAGQFLKENSNGGNSSYPYIFMDYHF